MMKEMDAPHHCHKRICWSAILVGAVTGVGLGFLLNLFGIAIGLTAFHAGSDGGLVIAIGGILGVLIGVIVSMFMAGYAAGYLGRHFCPQRNLGIVYGFTTWTVALFLSAVLGAQMTSYLSSYSNKMASSVVVIPESNSKVGETVVVKTAPASKSSKKSVELATPAAVLSYGALSLFILFFIGAFSSCLGACCAMRCKRED